jgi:predicted MPP superfamily phosphohydrolase
MRIFIFLFLWIVAEVIFYYLLKKTFHHSRRKKHLLFFNFFLLLFTILLMSAISIYPPHKWNHAFRILSATAMMIWFCKFISSIIFILIAPPAFIIKFIKNGISKKTKRNDDFLNQINPKPITRRAFIEKTALASGALMFGGFSFGMVKGAYNYKIHKLKLYFPQLPYKFNNLKMVQISDIHIGSFLNDEPLMRVSDIINGLNPDLILFTGDIVNNYAKELYGFEKVLSSLKAPMGVFSILGNHDYGDYVRWNSDKEKENNFNEILTFHREIGWRLLRNEHVILQRENDKIALLGVENWSKRLHFPRYGDMKPAYNGISDIPFKILLSHDPSHWDEEISKMYTDINLTLSGHTHGFQFGVEIPGWKWSPVKYIYPHWAGLYQSNEQFLYVNRGLGFIGYPGRLGIWPEITFIELVRT